MPDPVTFIRIVNPKKPGEFLVLADRDFDPAIHTRYVAPWEQPTQPATSVGAVTLEVTVPQAAVDEAITRATEQVEAGGDPDDAIRDAADSIVEARSVTTGFDINRSIEAAALATPRRKRQTRQE